MRLAIAATLLCFFASWGTGEAACACHCPPHPVRHWSAVHRLHRYVAARADAGCPVALAYVIKPGCNWDSHTDVPVE